MNPWSLSLYETAKERFEGPDEEVVVVIEELLILLIAVVESSVLLLYCYVVPHNVILPKIFMLSIAASRRLPPTLSK
jgi:hypothetical protein